jgi:hypothetical protein
MSLGRYMRDDRRGYESTATAAQKRKEMGPESAGSDLDRKFWIALALFAILAALVWFTMGAGSVLVFGRPVEMRLIPLIVISGLALRTVLARQAEKIRRGKDRQ